MLSSITEDSRLGRLLEFDERSLNYPIRPLLYTQARTPETKIWPCAAHLDQGQEGACVGFGWAHELVAAPQIVSSISNQSALELYKKAKTLDPWPGENYEGTTVLAGVKAVMFYYPTLYSSYRWAFGIDDLIATISFFGPVVLGIRWYKGMYPISSQVLVRPTGAVVGGHCILARGVDMEARVFTLRNSWGANWGNNGDCFVSFEDMAFLLANEGEAVIPIRNEVI